MPLNPHVKGGSDVPITDGGTGASDGATGLSNLGGLSSATHATTSHVGIPGVGDLTTATHNSLNHSGVTGVGKVLQRVYARGGTVPGLVTVAVNAMSVPPGPTQGTVVVSASITPISTSSKIRVRAAMIGEQTGALGGNIWSALSRDNAQLYHYIIDYDPTALYAEYDHGGSLAAQTWRVRGTISCAAGCSYNANNKAPLADSWIELLEIAD